MFLLPEKTVRLHMGFRGVGELYWIGDITDFMYHIRKLSVKMFATYSISDQVRIPDYRHRTWFQTRNFLCSTLSSVNYLCLCSAIDWGTPRVRLYPAILTRLTLECSRHLNINATNMWNGGSLSLYQLKRLIYNKQAVAEREPTGFLSPKLDH